MGQIITGDVGKKHKNSHRILWVVVAIVVAGGLGVVVRWFQGYQEQKENAAQTKLVEKINTAQTQSIVNGNYDKAIDTIEKELANPDISTDAKYTLLFQQGLAYENKKDFAGALETYKKADTVIATEGIAEAMARVAEAKGDKQLAIDYYKKAISRIEPDNPVGGDNKTRYEGEIKRLGSQP